MKPWDLLGDIPEPTIFSGYIAPWLYLFFSYFNVLICCQIKWHVSWYKGKDKLEKNNLFILSKNLSQSCFASIYLLPAGFVFLASPCFFLLLSVSLTAFPTCLITSFCFSPPLASLHILPLWPLAFPIFIFFSLSRLCLFFIFFFLTLTFYFSLSPVSSYWLPLILFYLITLPPYLDLKLLFLILFILSILFFSHLVFFLSSPWYVPGISFPPLLPLCPLMPPTLDPLADSGWDRGCSAPLMTSRSAKKWLVAQQQKKTSCLREPAAWGRAENGVVRKEEEVVLNGMEMEQVRENEMEKQRCTTLENLLGMRLSSDQLGAENGKKTSLLKWILCHNHEVFILSLPACLLRTVLFFPNHFLWSFPSRQTLLCTQPCLTPICWFIFSVTLAWPGV